MTNRDEVDAAFAAMLKAIPCPSCGAQFTDAAVQWCDAWIEGRHDLLREMNTTERDGPVKIRCERCGTRASVDIFRRAATVVSL
jgi:hypothetical protein